MNTPFPILPNLPLFKFCPTHLSFTSNTHPTFLSVVLSHWPNGWSRHVWCAILLNGNRDLHMSSFGTLVPEWPRCVFYATKQGVKVPEVWHIMWFFTGTQILYHTHTQTHTQTHTHTHTHTNTHTHTHTHTHTQGPVDRHAHINIYLHHLLCAHSSYLFTLIDSMNNSLISKIYFPQWVFFSKIIHS